MTLAEIRARLANLIRHPAPRTAHHDATRRAHKGALTPTRVTSTRAPRRMSGTRRVEGPFTAYSTGAHGVSVSAGSAPPPPSPSQLRAAGKLGEILERDGRRRCPERAGW